MEARVGLLLLLAGILLMARWVYRLTLHPLARFPGPKMAAMTNLFAMYYDLPKRTSFIKNFPMWHRKYGPIVRIGPNDLHILDIDAYNQVFKMGTKFNKDPRLYDFPFTAGALSNQCDVKAGKAHRDMYAPYFTRAAVQSMGSVIHENVGTFLLRIDELARKGSSINMHLAFRCLTADIVLKYVFDQNFGALHGPNGFAYDMVEPVETYMADWTFTLGWYAPGLMKSVARFCKAYPRIGRMNGAFKAVMEQMDFCRARIQHLKDTKKPNEAHFFQTAMNPDPNRGHPIQSEDALAADAWLLYFAGTDTSGTTLTFGTWYLLNNPEYLHRLQQELKQAIPYSENLEHVQESWAKLEKLDFLRCVVKESLRLAFGLVGKNPRVASSQGAELCGQSIPPGTVISMSAYTYHINPDFFKTHPAHEFRPERWLNQEDAEWNEKFFVPFQRGSRDCIGRHLALASLYLTFAYTFRRFEFEIDGTTAADMDWHDAMIAMTFGHLKVKARRVTA